MAAQSQPGSSEESMHTPKLHIEVAQSEGWITALDLVAPEENWTFRAWREDGAWWLVYDDEAAPARRDSWPEVFDGLPETVGGVAVRAQVGERVDREGQIRPRGRSMLRDELSQGLGELARLYGEQEIAAWIAEEAGKRGLRLAAEPQAETELRGPAFAEASTDPDRNLM
jgi:hypothetical protein